MLHTPERKQDLLSFESLVTYPGARAGAGLDSLYTYSSGHTHTTHIKYSVLPNEIVRIVTVKDGKMGKILNKI